jgi:GT2 family glycosyltransferase
LVQQVSATPEISIIVVSFNTREMTLECLRSVIAETQTTDYELLVVDNASSDGSAAAIAAEFPDLRLIALEENIGFARANNLAAESARGERLLLLNPDTVVLDRALDRLVAFADSRPAARIWGGRTLFADHSLNPGSCWAAMSVWGLFSRAVGLTMLFPHSERFNPEPLGGWQRDSVREVDIVTGCLLLIDRPLWDELGAFDPRFFMYGEEADLCIRAIDRGATPVITPDATIIHYGSASDTGNKASAVAAARITLIREHWSPIPRRAGIFLSWASALTHHVAYATATKLLPGRKRLEDSARMHSGVWHDRHRWLAGY